MAVLAPNTHVLLEANFGVPWAGVALVAVNTRLSAGEIAYILEHSEASVLVHDPAFDELVDAAFEQMTQSADPDPGRGASTRSCSRARSRWRSRPTTSGRCCRSTTRPAPPGRPKGVMYHHRGAYLQALAMVGHTGLTPSSVHLWTLPMFHCNGWCFPWAVTAAGGDARVPAAGWTRPRCGD